MQWINWWSSIQIITIATSLHHLISMEKRTLLLPLQVMRHAQPINYCTLKKTTSLRTKTKRIVEDKKKLSRSESQYSWQIRSSSSSSPTLTTSTRFVHWTPWRMPIDFCVSISTFAFSFALLSTHGNWNCLEYLNSPRCHCDTDYLSSRLHFECRVQRSSILSKRCYNI